MSWVLPDRRNRFPEKVVTARSSRSSTRETQFRRFGRVIRPLPVSRRVANRRQKLQAFRKHRRAFVLFALVEIQTPRGGQRTSSVSDFQNEGWICGFRQRRFGWRFSSASFDFKISVLPCAHSLLVFFARRRGLHFRQLGLSRFKKSNDDGCHCNGSVRRAKLKKCFWQLDL